MSSRPEALQQRPAPCELFSVIWAGSVDVYRTGSAMPHFHSTHVHTREPREGRAGEHTTSRHFLSANSKIPRFHEPFWLGAHLRRGLITAVIADPMPQQQRGSAKRPTARRDRWVLAAEVRQDLHRTRLRQDGGILAASTTPTLVHLRRRRTERRGSSRRAPGRAKVAKDWAHAGQHRRRSLCPDKMRSRVGEHDSCIDSVFLGARGGLEWEGTVCNGSTQRASAQSDRAPIASKIVVHHCAQPSRPFGPRHRACCADLSAPPAAPRRHLVGRLRTDGAPTECDQGPGDSETPVGPHSHVSAMRTSRRVAGVKSPFSSPRQQRSAAPQRSSARTRLCPWC